ncbi:MAG TPA: protein TolR [Bdellovibrionota bacterium]|nr:protein TolR [Bdellovibrionota bacterium]
MAISTRNDHGPLSEINVTPFVDVMLVLLVIFMVTAPLIQQQVDIDLPATSSKKSVAVTEQDVVLTIDKKQQLSIAKTKVGVQDLSVKLKEVFRNKQKKEIYLRADKTVPYGFVVKVMALVKNAGIDRMGMITDQENDGG